MVQLITIKLWHTKQFHFVHDAFEICNLNFLQAFFLTGKHLFVSEIDTLLKQLNNTYKQSI